MPALPRTPCGGGLRTSPWVTGAALLAFAVVAVLRWSVAGPEQAVALLSCAPTMVLAWQFGLRGGLVGSGLGVALLVAWVVDTGSHLGAVGWVARLTPLVLSGVVVGWLAQPGPRSAEQGGPGAVGEDLDAVEANDRLVQQVVAARWCLEAGQGERALGLMDEAVELGHALVGELVRGHGHGAAWTGTAVAREPSAPEGHQVSRPETPPSA